jgi:hypothetical protein
MIDVREKFKQAIPNAFSSPTGTESQPPITSGEGIIDMVGYMKENEMDEKWSEKYKKSIDCNNPKGFSQRAHCQGRKKKENKEATGAGSAGGYSAPLFGKEMKERDDFTNYHISPKGKVSKDGDVKKMETKEATGAGSSGSYETTAAWSKSMNKKDWRGASKTQIPGGKFVQVKKKCTKFPYCNQGDIKALKIFENETLQRVIKNLSIKHNLSEDIIKSVILTEIKNKL